MAYRRQPDEPGDGDGDSPRLDVPDALLDAWLLRYFPGRFLDEIDTAMDWPRFLAAMEAGAAERIEERRDMLMEKKLKQSDLSAEDFAAIARHDELLEELNAVESH